MDTWNPEEPTMETTDTAHGWQIHINNSYFNDGLVSGKCAFGSGLGTPVGSNLDTLVVTSPVAPLRVIISWLLASR